MDDLFFINKNRNDRFYYFRGSDLKLLITQILNYDLVYREKLNLSPLVTFGIEMEYEGVDKKLIDDYLESNRLKNFISTTDYSLDSGGEIITPVLSDTKNAWKRVGVVSDYLRSLKPVLDKNASSHVHIGAHILDEAYKWKLFLKTYTYYEDILFRFGYGDKINARRKIMCFADPISDDLYTYLDAIDDVKRIEEFSNLFQELYYRNQALNLDNVRFYYIEDKKDKNTVEFRFPNGTCDKVILQNNVNVFAKLMGVYSSCLMDEDALDYKIKNKRISSEDDFFLYGEVNLKKALDFVDLVFDNNLDKVYFLRQYLKNFESGYRINGSKSTKVFTRK